MTPEQLTAELKEILGANMLSVLLYGSAAVNDQTKHYSNINILVVVETMSVDLLKKVSSVVKNWRKEGNPTPLFLTHLSMDCSLDVFPIEYADIQDSHRVLYGNDPFENLVISDENLRHQLEYELRSKLIQLESRFIETEGKEKLIQELISKAMSSVTTLFNATLRLVSGKSAIKKRDIWTELNAIIPLDIQAMEEIMMIREGKMPTTSVHELFVRLFACMQRVTAYVDQFQD